MRLLSWLKRITCLHDMATVWERDYKEHVLGQSPSGFRSLSGSQTVRVCRKCGAVRPGPFIKAEEERWAEARIISHFDGSEVME